MSVTSINDLLTIATRLDRAASTRMRITAEEITEAENDKYEYACSDCEERGHHLRLKFVRAAGRHVAFRQWDKRTGEVREGSKREKYFILPKHFDRWPDAGEHKCEQPVRYAAFRQFGFRVNARVESANQLILPMVLPGVRLHSHAQARQNDLRIATRPVGMELGGLQRAKDFIRLFEFFKKDPGLQNMQYLHDGLTLRTIHETYFEKPSRLYNYLRMKDAVGRDASHIVIYLLNPNTSTPAINDPKTQGGFIDRSIPMIEGGGNLKLYVRGMNKESIEALKEVALRHNRYMAAPTLVYGEAYLSAQNPHQVEIEIFKPKQVIAYEDPFLLHSSKKLSGTREMTAARQESFGL